MGLIDKDAAKADIEKFNRPLCDGYHMKDYVLNQIITDIENQPTVEAIPIVYIRRVMAHWKEYESEWDGFWWRALDRLIKGWLEKEKENAE